MSSAQAVSAPPTPLRKRSRLGCALLTILFLVVAALAGGYVWLRASVEREVHHQAADQVITVEPGMSTQAIINRLSEAGIVTDPTALKFYMRITGGAPLRAGDYQFDSPISPLAAVDKIQRGLVYIERVTIPRATTVSTSRRLLRPRRPRLRKKSSCGSRRTRRLSFPHRRRRATLKAISFQTRTTTTRRRRPPS